VTATQQLESIDGSIDALGAALLGGESSSAAVAADGRAGVALSLGWRMAEIFRPQVLGISEPTAGTLPALGQLDEREQLELRLDEIVAAVHRLGAASAECLAALTTVRTSLGESEADRRVAVEAAHRVVMARVTAADPSLAKAYGTGLALADTCLGPGAKADIERRLAAPMVAHLLAALDELSSLLPAHAAHSVAASLERWRDWATESNAVTDDTLVILQRQGELWRALLSGEKQGPDLLEIENYLDAAEQLASRGRALLLNAIKHYPVAVGIVVVLLCGGVALLVLGGPTRLVAGATSVLAALGITWRGLSTILDRVGSQLEQPLWGAVLDQAIADAVSLVPVPAANGGKADKDYRGRRRIAGDLTASSVSASDSLSPVPEPPPGARE
jgi:hypothetical protein